MLGILKRLLGRNGHDIQELTRRLGVPAHQLRAVEPHYTQFSIPKRSGGVRSINAPSPELKTLQRRVLRRLLDRLRVHPAATGFQRGHSIVSNAAFHSGKAVVVCMDIKDFFTATSAKRVRKYFSNIGWNREAADLLTRVCTLSKCLPQGAPTSPRLVNLVNYPLDVRLSAVAARLGAAYSRYADNMTFSFDTDDARLVHALIRIVKGILAEYGYEMHHGKKLQIRRRHQRQIITGLVVNRLPALPRETRRWLRAIDHRIETNREPTITPEQREGWYALESMIESQRGPAR